MPKNEVALRQNEKVEKESGKLTLEEYQKKYSKPVNEKVAKTFLFVFAAAIGIVIFFCLFLIVLRLFELHQIAGYVGIGVTIFKFAHMKLAGCNACVRAVRVTVNIE